jgi:hypothetical protein
MEESGKIGGNGSRIGKKRSGTKKVMATPREGRRCQ